MPTEHDGRVARLQEALRLRGLDAALLLQAADVFYYTGTRQDAALWVRAGDEPLLLVRRSLARAREECRLRDVRPLPPGRDLPAALGPASRVGMTFDAVPVEVQRLWADALPGAELVDVSAAVRDQRSQKSAAEIERMRATARMLCDAYREIPSFLRPGVRELDLAAELEYRMRKGGNEGAPRLRRFNQELFIGLAVAGPAAAMPGGFDGPLNGRGLSPAAPNGASRRPVPRDAPILFDYTGIMGGYIVDMTRLAVMGRLAPGLERAFGVALEIQAELVRRLVPGEIPSRLWGRAKEMAEAAGLGSCFMGPPGAQARFVGHGVGLELDELPVLASGFDAPLREGQTVALEPKFVFPDLGAVGIENTWAVAPGGGVRITELPDDVIRV
ncbi:MAG TPA: Xaa-Pro peptidase family protein [Anaeromyxobacteraceae bacterium]